MRGYLKSIVKSTLDQIISDEFIEPISESQVYQIVNRNFRRKSEHNQIRNHKKRSESIHQLSEKTGNLIEQCLIMTPQRQFKILGYEPSFQSVNLRIKSVKQNLQGVTEIMMQNFPKYRDLINKSLNELEGLHGLQVSRTKGTELREKLKRLEDATYKSKKVTQLNIKTRNIKSVLNLLKEIPNIQKMTLIDLKGIKERKIRYNQKLKNLYCMRGLSAYIDRVVGEQLAHVIRVLQECIIHKFDKQAYEQALKNFIITEHEKIKYERMLIKLVQKQVRRYASQLGTDLFQICQFYIKIMINLHAVFGWHRQNQEGETEKIRKLSNQIIVSHNSAEQNYEDEDDPLLGNNKSSTQYPSINIKISYVTDLIAECMDQCLKFCIYQRFHNPENSIVYLETVYLIFRMSEIVQNFSGRKLKHCFQQMNNNYEKQCKKLKEKGFNELKQALNFQDKNDWNRFPVPSNYSHTVFDKAIYQIWRTKDSHPYKKCIKLITKYKNKSCQEEQEEGWEIEPLSLQPFEKFEKYEAEMKIKYPDEVIICQSSITLLKYIEKLVEFEFYNPIHFLKDEKEGGLELPESYKNCFYLLDYYFYYIFQSLCSIPIKRLICSKLNNIQGLQQKYHKKRLDYHFQYFTTFIYNFLMDQNDKKFHGTGHLGKERENAESNSINNPQNSSEIIKLSIVKCRVVACESTSYICAYFSHMAKLCGTNSTNISYSDEFCKKINFYKELTGQFAQLVYTDILPKTFNSNKIRSLIVNIKWADEIDGHIKQYSDILVKTFQDFYSRIKAENKGVIPIKINNQLFGFYWKIQLNFIIKSFLQVYIRKRTINSSQMEKFQTFIDHAYEQILPVFANNISRKDQSSKQYITSYYIKVKQIFQICLEEQWEKLFEHIKSTIDNYDYVYKIQLGMLNLSKCALIKDEEQLSKHRRQVQSYIESKLNN